MKHSPPSTEAFQTALRQMELAGALPDTYWKLLRRHHAGPGHTLTTMELAAAMGWDTHSPVNVHYGSFAEKLAKRMKWAVPPGAPQAAAVATFEGGGPDDPHTRWIMRPELASALERLRMVPVAPPSTPPGAA